MRTLQNQKVCLFETPYTRKSCLLVTLQKNLVDIFRFSFLKVYIQTLKSVKYKNIKMNKLGNSVEKI